MNPNFLKALKSKKKRAVDPNAPPRPNLMTHEVKIRDQQNTVEYLNQTVNNLNDKLRRLDNKLKAQQDYIQYIHNKLIKR